MLSKIKFENKFLLVYLLLGGGWILFSDRLLLILVDDRESLSMLQTYKGWFYVLLTAFIFYFIIRKHVIKLRNAEQKAKKNDQLKSIFIQNISHEVRTPMNSIVGFSDLLISEDELSLQNYRYYAENIIKNSQQLLSVIDNVLDISIIDSGNLLIANEKIIVDSFLEDLEQNFQPLLKEGVTLRLEYTKQPNKLVIYTDKIRLWQIFNNLVTNAIKFTPHGEINIGYTVGEQEVCFYVTDNGIGILPQDQSAIFERFMQ